MRRRLSTRAVWGLVAIGRLGGAIAVVAVVVVLWMFFIREPVQKVERAEPKAPTVRRPQEGHPQERRIEPEPDEAPLRAFVPPPQEEIDRAVLQIKVIFGIGIGGAFLFLMLYFILYSPPTSAPRKSGPRPSTDKGGGAERPRREPKEERKVWDLDDPNTW